MQQCDSAANEWVWPRSARYGARRRMRRSRSRRTSMTTRSRHSLVSLTALTLSLTVGACGGARSNSLAEEPDPASGRTAIQFDNQSHDYVYLYLLGIKDQWLLGRVEAGSRVELTM